MVTVAYFSQRFPSQTMTFTYREVMALRRRGVTVRTIATWRPDQDALAAEAQPLIGETFYIFPAAWPQLAALHLRYLFTRPAAYLSTLARVLIFNREGPAERLRLLGQFGYAVRAAAEAERCRADHLHADFALNAATVAWIAARLTGRPFSFTAHAADIFVNPILLREKLAEAAFVVPISEYNRRYLADLSADPEVAARLHVIHCGLDLRQFTPDPGRGPNQPPVILAVGRLIEKKGLRYLVEACRHLAQRGQGFECRIIGQGPEEAALRRLAADHALSDRVRLLGALPQEQVREQLRQADVFALPSVVGRDRDQDGIPVVLMEAMAMGVPVVSTRLSGITELVQDGVNGLLVAPNDAPALADAIQRLLHDPALARHFSRHGRATVEREFDIEVSAERLAVLYEGSSRGHGVARHARAAEGAEPRPMQERG